MNRPTSSICATYDMNRPTICAVGPYESEYATQGRMQATCHGQRTARPDRFRGPWCFLTSRLPNALLKQAATLASLGPALRGVPKAVCEGGEYEAEQAGSQCTSGEACEGHVCPHSESRAAAVLPSPPLRDTNRTSAGERRS